MDTSKVYDIVGIGIGPFNLGMAALAEDIDNLECAFIDKEPEFNWHAGMMIPGTSLQVPFYADLVTLAKPESKYSFLNYLKQKKRLFRFAIHENNFVSRREYNDYCQWVAGHLSSLNFGYACNAIHYNSNTDLYEVFISNTGSRNSKQLKCKNVVIGIGTVPHIPDCASKFKHPLVFHSAEYLKHKEALSSKKSICIVGSGQSAAEIFYDLVNNPAFSETELNWFTRSERFFPMEYSKLSLEMTSPDYIEHFYGLSAERKTDTLKKQDMLYKGINFSLINSIYDSLYQQQFETDLRKPRLYSNCEMHSMIHTGKHEVKLGFLHCEKEESFSIVSDAVIMATGYSNHLPFIVETADGPINWDSRKKLPVNRNYSINESQNVFVQNADLHSHGFTSPDLGMGPYRNATILNSILGYEYFEMERNIAFQTFGVPQG